MLIKLREGEKRIGVEGLNKTEFKYEEGICPEWVKCTVSPISAQLCSPVQ